VRLVSFRDRASTVGVGEGEVIHVLRAASVLDWLAGEGRE
jgi:hypothetical protein